MKQGDLVINRIDGGVGWCHPLDRGQTPGVLVKVTYEPITPTDPQWSEFRQPLAEVLWPGSGVLTHPLEDLILLEDHLRDMRRIRAEADYDDHLYDAGIWDIDDGPDDVLDYSRGWV